MILLDISVALFILLIIYTWSWWLFRTEKENQTPNFLKDNNKEIIYQPQKDYFDKLEFQDHDIIKVIDESREERTEGLLSIFESSPIPRHPKTYGDLSVAQSEFTDKNRIIQSRHPRP